MRGSSFERPLVTVRGDGNCLYYSLMAGLVLMNHPRRPRNAKALKKQLLTYIEEHGRVDQRILFVMQGLDHDRWLAEHHRPNAWGDEVVIVAFTRLYQDIRLECISKSRLGYHSQIFNEHATTTMVIGTDQRHFNLITCLCPRAYDLSRAVDYNYKSKIRWV